MCYVRVGVPRPTELEPWGGGSRQGLPESQRRHRGPWRVSEVLGSTSAPVVEKKPLKPKGVLSRGHKSFEPS